MSGGPVTCRGIGTTEVHPLRTPTSIADEPAILAELPWPRHAVLSEFRLGSLNGCVTAGNNDDEDTLDPLGLPGCESDPTRDGPGRGGRRRSAPAAPRRPALLPRRGQHAATGADD